MKRANEIELVQLKQESMTGGEYASKFEELGNYYTFFYHPYERMGYIEFENEFRLKLRKNNRNVTNF